MHGCTLAREYFAGKKIASVLTSYGSRYTKEPRYEADHKATQPFTAKQGREETEALFANMIQHFKAKSMSLTDLSTSWNTTSWLFGWDTKKYTSASFTPNSAASMRFLAMGEIQMLLAPISSVLAAMEKAGAERTSIGQVVAYIQNLDAPGVTKFKDDGCQFAYAKVSKHDCIYIPAGFVCIEKPTTTSPLLYGIRKSYMFSTAATFKEFKLATALQSGAGAEKLQMVCDLLHKADKAD